MPESRAEIEAKLALAIAEEELLAAKEARRENPDSAKAVERHAEAVAAIQALRAANRS